jgi:hypothetical protein
MAQQAVVTLKDGTKINIEDLSQLGQYSSRQDLESISFFGEKEVADAGVADAGVQQTVAVVEQPKADPAVPKPQPAPDSSAAVTATIGALAGAISSAGMPALANLAKSFLKGKLKLKNKSGGDSKPEEEKEEPTDCKTHQLKASAKFASISARLSALESKNSQGDSPFGKLNSEETDLEERIIKIEKQLKTINGKGKQNVKKRN